jgi:hypothetical protein
MQKQERRFFKAAEVRVSASGGISGYAAVFNQLSEDLGGFREKILPGAFSRCLGSNPDVRCLFNHNSDALLGRTKAGTLRLSEDRTGLYFDCDLPDTQAGRDVRASIKRGDITQCSFGFTVQGQNWLENGTVRELTDVDLFDVSPVTYAAYPQTSVSARQQQIMPSTLLWPEGQPAEIRARQSTARRLGPAPARPAPAPAASPIPAKSDREMLADINARLARHATLGIGVSKSKKTRSNSTMRYNSSSMTAAETAELRTFLQSGGFERRDLTSSTAGVFIPEAFNRMVWEAMRAYDSIFDDDFSTTIETDTGAAMDLFAVDDTETSASIVGEGTGSGEVDPTAFKVQLAQAPLWDSKVVAVSMALLQDSAVDLPAMLSQALGARLARGIAPSLISTLLAAADLGATAAGDPVNGSNGATQVGYADLIALRTSLNTAYRASGKCAWLMNDNTLAALDSLTDKNLRPLIHPVYVNGQRMLLGYPVGICPSLPNIGHSNTPILFGALGYFVVRVVKDGGEKESGRLIRITEAQGYIENLLVGFKSFLRCNGALLAAQAGSPLMSDSPVKYLQNS